MHAGGARLMIGFNGYEPSSELAEQLEATGARGLILYARNIRSAAQTRELISGLRELARWPILIAVDQEGGPVVRVQVGGTLFPGNMALGASGREDLALRQGEASGRQLAAMGFDLNLAPVIDLQTNPLNPGIGIRSLGAQRGRAARLATALVRGHLRSGVHSCLKHFPGKGAASVDAHRDLPVLDLPVEAFYDPHLGIFEDVLAELDPPPPIMSSHVIVTGLDPDAPATLSAAVARHLLRERMGFDGLLLTDDLEMGAIIKYGGVGSAAVAAARGSHDLILVCHDPTRQREAARALELALEDGSLDRDEHELAIARIEAHAGTAALARTRLELDCAAAPDDGDRVAREIANQAVHIFGDAHGLIPLDATHGCVVIAFRPKAIVDVEETRSDGGFGTALRRSLEGADIQCRDVHILESSQAAPEGLLDRCAGADRILLYTWDALRQAPVRGLLEAACARFGDRLVVVHLRNPFDQTLLPEGITSLTAFGYHPCQLDALASVLAGRSSAAGSLPAPLVCAGV